MGKTVFITGASRGIGAQTAHIFAEKGWQVAIGYHKNAALADMLAAQLSQLGVLSATFGGDISHGETCDDLIAQVVARFGTLDALVCNAGSAHFGQIQDCTNEQWRQVMGENLDSAFYLVRAALPHMLSKKSGAIVTVSSIWGMEGASCESAYSAAKAGLIGFTKAAAKELAPAGIRVNCVAPGVIDTDMNGHLDPQTRAQLAEDIPQGRFGTAREVGEVISFLCSDAASYLTGQVICPNGGMGMT